LNDLTLYRPYGSVAEEATAVDEGGGGGDGGG
jgi:hypothetical protein